MTTSTGKARHSLIIPLLFVVFLIIQLYALASGLAWIEVNPIQFNFWLSVLVAIVATVAGIVATYSFVQYNQERCFRDFIFSLIGINIVLLAFLFLLTHPAASWSAFSDRQRNMTIVAAIGYLVTPGMLASSIVNDNYVTRKTKCIALLLGTVILPLISVWMFLAPEPIFRLTGPGIGLGVLTPHAWFLAIIIGITSLVAFLRYLQEWLRGHDRIILSAALALVHWILAFLIYLVIESPLQVAELLWFSSIAAGFILLAIAMVVTSIIEPHRALEMIIEERTSQLKESQEETEFYLKLWTHKIGNLLQGISTYLELIGYQAEEVSGLVNLRKPAADLVKESILVNRQIGRLIRIKEKTSSATWPVSLMHALMKSKDEVREILDENLVSVRIPRIEESLQVVADDLIDIVFINLITKCFNNGHHVQPKIAMSVAVNQNHVHVKFKPCPIESDIKIRDYLKRKPSLKESIADLDFFMSWTIMERYGGAINYEENPHTKENVLVLTFKRAF
ncbi:MAG: hypothetical protein ACFE9W_12010 [Promethearchaeota archaeon]